MFSIRWACEIEEITKWRQATTNRCTCTRCSRTALTRSRINNQVGVAVTLTYGRRWKDAYGPVDSYRRRIYFNLDVVTSLPDWPSPRFCTSARFRRPWAEDGFQNYSRTTTRLRDHEDARRSCSEAI